MRPCVRRRRHEAPTCRAARDRTGNLDALDAQPRIDRPAAHAEGLGVIFGADEVIVRPSHASDGGDSDELPVSSCGGDP